MHQFAYSAAHDLRDPLRNISLATSLIYEKFKAKDYDEIEDLLKRLLHTASYGGSLVKNLLDYSAANREMKMELVCLNDVVTQTITVLNTLIEQAEAKIVLKKLPTVWGNNQQLQIVFQNVISNAIRYRGDLPLIISISTQRKKSLWVISIKDNGPGVPEEFKDEIFQPFKRLSAKASGRSSGLGLSICRRIIEQHGGEIWLDTQSGPGACFKFTLQKG
ncbi:sensor histidine kinase [Candidatus Paracaedibacter symbiosus]|uniref:sensor histidine kinase n=1 Tax=Candidatus Paracaedibacter symbiosus TaxID=244582 RepID=UPI000509E043|nr:HAMP domain-containing sensor histidine kinase [Candidatus Paracaedibacter symbiosus]